MIPPFNEDGYLPPGVHQATLEEIAERFGRESEIRQAEMESIRWLVNIAQRAGVKRIVINGSFVTDKYEPNDADCVLLFDETYPHDLEAHEELEDGLPFLEFSVVDQENFDRIVFVDYASDRDRVNKGMIEVIGWESKTNAN